MRRTGFSSMRRKNVSLGRYLISDTVCFFSFLKLMVSNIATITFTRESKGLKRIDHSTRRYRRVFDLVSCGEGPRITYSLVTAPDVGDRDVDPSEEAKDLSVDFSGPRNRGLRYSRAV